MPVHLSERNGKFCVTEPDGTVKKCYDSKEAALKYLRAINMHLKSKSVKIKASELVAGEHMAPAIQIVSDGTADGTALFVHGVAVPFANLSFYCYSGDYPSCSMSIMTKEIGPDGLTVERSFNLRHSPPAAEVKSNG